MPELEVPDWFLMGKTYYQSVRLVPLVQWDEKRRGHLDTQWFRVVEDGSIMRVSGLGDFKPATPEQAALVAEALLKLG